MQFTMNLDCSDNQLESLDGSDCIALTFLDCSGNLLMFPTLLLPSQTLDILECSNQWVVNIASTPPVGDVFDLSSEYLGGATTNTWYFANLLPNRYRLQCPRSVGGFDDSLLR
jgi:hypothetical protein